MRSRGRGPGPQRTAPRCPPLRERLHDHVREGALAGRRRRRQHLGRPRAPLRRDVRRPSRRPWRAPDPAHGGGAARLLRALLRRLPGRLLQPRDDGGTRPVREGHGEVRHPLPLPRNGGRPSRGALRGLLLAHARRGSSAAWSPTASTGCSSSRWPRAPVGISTSRCSARSARYQRGGINVYGAVGGENVYRTNALTLDPNHLGVMLVVPLLVLLPIYLRLERGHRLRTPLALVSRSSRSSSSRRCHGAACSESRSVCSCSRFRTGGGCCRLGCSCRSCSPGRSSQSSSPSAPASSRRS